MNSAQEIPTFKILSGILAALTSLFILIHLYVILSVPYHRDYDWKKYPRFLTSYIKFFEFTANWIFFAPEVGPPPDFLEWELYSSDWDLLEKNRWPSDNDRFFFSERHIQRVASSRFWLYHQDIASKMMTKYLCDKDRRAASVRLWSIVFPPPVTKQSLSSEDLLAKVEIKDKGEPKILRSFISDKNCVHSEI